MDKWPKHGGEEYPTVAMLRTFGCVTYSHLLKEQRVDQDKLSRVAEKGILVGYGSRMRGWKVFFPEKGCSKAEYARAKKICQSCTVSRQCGDYAMQWDERYMVGIWGGMTGIERRVERNKRNTEDN